MSDLSRLKDDHERGVLWLFGACHELKRWGLVTPSWHLSSEGMAAWLELDAAYKITDELLYSIVPTLARHEPKLLVDALCRTLIYFRDERESLERSLLKQGYTKKEVDGCKNQATRSSEDS